MHWKLKAAIQTATALLPSSGSYSLYYWIQRQFGGLKSADPLERLAVGVETWERIRIQNVEPSDKVFFEVGTGRVPLVPLAFWLMGARRSITIDANPYLKAELVRRGLTWIARNVDQVRQIFGGRLKETRLEQLLQLTDHDFCVDRFLEMCCIEYIAPGDAAETGLPAASIDFHTSYMVLEHIAPDVLRRILLEANRITRNDGLLVHRIDYSDHFAHSDKNISSINFLQYSDVQWARYAGNRYMYMNRLRHDDLLTLFRLSGVQVLSTTLFKDEQVLQILREGRLRLDERFEGKTWDVLAVVGGWVIAQTQSPNRAI
jgi:SAM-dependent methyltransferase